jgi:hypothetical protein
VFAILSASNISTWNLSGLSLIVAVLAYRKTVQTDRRDRSAIIVIEQVWENRGNPVRWVAISSHERRQEDTNPRPHKPDLNLVITGNPVIADGLVLQAETETHRRDEDKQGYESHRVELKLENVGRSAATDVRIGCTLAGTYLTRWDEGTEERLFNDFIEIESIPAGGSRYLEIRNIPSIPVALSFDSIQTQDKGQPVTLSGRRSINFHARG